MFIKFRAASCTSVSMFFTNNDNCLFLCCTSGTGSSQWMSHHRTWSVGSIFSRMPTFSNLQRFSNTAEETLHLHNFSLQTPSSYWGLIFEVLICLGAVTSQFDFHGNSQIQMLDFRASQRCQAPTKRDFTVWAPMKNTKTVALFHWLGHQQNRLTACFCLWISAPLEILQSDIALNVWTGQSRKNTKLADFLGQLFRSFCRIQSVFGQRIKLFEFFVAMGVKLFESYLAKGVELVRSYLAKRVELFESYLVSSFCSLLQTISIEFFVWWHLSVPIQIRSNGFMTVFLYRHNFEDIFRMHPLNLFTSGSKHKKFWQVSPFDLIPESSSSIQDLIILIKNIWYFFFHLNALIIYLELLTKCLQNRFWRARVEQRGLYLTSHPIS